MSTTDATTANEAGRWSLFAVLLALAAIWHLLGNVLVPSNLAHAALAIAAGWVIARPGNLGALAGLALAGIWSAWDEAPMLSNHWLLAAFVGLAILVAIAVAAVRRGGRPARGDVAALALPAARACLLGFYSFAAFSKLNAAFFDRSVSCAIYFFDESTRSIHLDGLSLAGHTWGQTLVIYGTAATELSIPALLVWRRTRTLGVAVAIAFHGVLALDRTHEFFDFTSLLVALFTLFLPADFPGWVTERSARLGRSWCRVTGVRAGLWTAVAGAMAALVGLAAQPQYALNGSQARTLGWWTWQAALVVLLATVGAYLWSRRGNLVVPARSLRIVPTAALAVVPMLVVLNGLTPYLELKTGYAWNMYSNLRTVAGDSNHFLIRATLPLTTEQKDLVIIESTDDPGLQWYVKNHYALTWRQLRTYLSHHRDASLVYRRGGQLHRVARAGHVAALVKPASEVQDKLQLFRAVDLDSPERCVPLWGAAR